MRVCKIFVPCRRVALDGTLAQPVPQVGGDLVAKVAQAEMAPDVQRLSPLRLRTAGPVEEQHRRQTELARKVVDDFDRSKSVVVEEAAVQTHNAELQGEAAAMVGATAFSDHGQVRRGQAPVPHALVLACAFRDNPCLRPSTNPSRGTHNVPDARNRPYLLKGCRP